MKTKIKRWFKIVMSILAIIAIIMIAGVVAWEQVRADVIDWYDGEEVVYTRNEVVENKKEQSRIEELMNSAQAIEAGKSAQEAEAKKMRLQELADEAKEIQSSLK